MAQEMVKNQSQKTKPYTMKDAIKVADDIFKLTKDKKYNLGAFIHGLIFALEYAQYSYKVPQQQIATIKRDCRKYFQEVKSSNVTKTQIFLFFLYVNFLFSFVLFFLIFF